MKTKYLIWGGIGLLVVWLWKSGKLSGLSTALTKVGAQVNPANANIPSAAAPNILAQGQDYLAAAGGVSSAAGSSLKSVWGNITGMFGGASTATGTPGPTTSSGGAGVPQPSGNPNNSDNTDFAGSSDDLGDDDSSDFGS